MIYHGVNLVAIAVAAVAAFGFGALYYTVLAGPWARAQGRSHEDFRPTAGLFALSFLGCLLLSAIMAGMLFHVGEYSVRNGLISGALIWTGFILTTMTVNNAYRGGRIALTAIDAGHWLGVCLLTAAIIGWFGV